MALSEILDANVAPALQIHYSNMESALFFENRPLTGLLPKGKGGGSKYLHTLKVDNGQGVSSDFPTAQSDTALATRYAMTMDWAEKYAVGRVKNTAIELAQGVDSQVNLFVSEQDSKLKALSESIERVLHRSGYGDIGAIKSISTDTITLTYRSDARNFTPGKKVQFAAAVNSGALRNTAGTLTVKAVDRDAGTIQFTANVSTLNQVQVNDVIFENGTRQDSATPSPTEAIGLEGWFPFSVTAGENFGGIDRSVDRVLLAGTYTDGRGLSALEAVNNHLARVGEYGKTPDLMLCHPDFWNRLNKDLQAKGTIDLEGKDVKGITFKAIEFNGVTGPIAIVADPFCKPDRFYTLTTDTMEVLSGLPGGKLIANPLASGKLLDMATQDAVEFRNKALCLVVCHDPSANGVCQTA